MLTAVILVAASLYFVFYYVPPPTTTVRTYSCQVSSHASNNSILNFSVVGIALNLTFEPTAPNLEAGSCMYKTTNETIPVRCGSLCGPQGLGDEYKYTKELQIGFAFSSMSADSNYSLILSTQGSKLFGLFLPYVQVYVDSRSVMWSSFPPTNPNPCSKNIPYLTGCSIDQNTTSLKIEFPAYNGSVSTHELLINSTEMLIP